MKIGFDAKRAFNNFTGLGNYSRTLIETMAHYYPEHEYLLYTPRIKDNPRLDFLKRYPSVKTISPTGFYKKIAALWRTYFIRKDIKKAQLDIFHGLSHELPMNIPKGVKTVVTMHDLIHERFPEFYPLIDRTIYSLKFRSACRRADVIVAISEATKQDIIELYGINPDKIQVIYQSCHAQFYIDIPHTLSEKTAQMLPPQYLLYVGTINERKNLLGLVKAIKMLNERFKIPLVVIGDGEDYLKKVQAYIQAENMEKDIIFLKGVPFSDFPMIYKKASAMILPSFQEGFGIPIIEALWSGCPVITSQGSCFPEAAGPDSLYIDPHNSSEIAEAMYKVLADNALREHMILRGGEYVQRFHEKYIAEQWNRLYLTL